MSKDGEESKEGPRRSQRAPLQHRASVRQVLQNHSHPFDLKREVTFRASRSHCENSVRQNVTGQGKPTQMSAAAVATQPGGRRLPFAISPLPGKGLAPSELGWQRRACALVQGRKTTAGCLHLCLSVFLQACAPIHTMQPLIISQHAAGKAQWFVK